MIGIYKITSPSGKVYIGQSVNIKERFKSHLKNRKKISNPRLYNSFKKYGKDSHKFEVILECSIEDLNSKERYYQEMYDVLGGNGLNCKLTQDGDRVGVHSEETLFKMRKPRSEEAKLNMKLSGYQRSKIVESNSNRKISEETRKKMSESKKGKKLSKEATARRVELFKNKVVSDETKRKMSEVNKGNKYCLGYKHSEETKIKGAESRSKIIMDTQIGVFYLGYKQASVAIGVNERTLQYQLTGASPNKTNLILT